MEMEPKALYPKTVFLHSSKCTRYLYFCRHETKTQSIRQMTKLTNVYLDICLCISRCQIRITHPSFPMRRCQVAPVGKIGPIKLNETGRARKLSAIKQRTTFCPVKSILVLNYSHIERGSMEFVPPS